MHQQKAFLTMTAAVAATMLTAGAAPQGLTPFRPGETTVGGEIGERCRLTVEKMTRHTDIENTFAKHFRVRKEKPAEPWGFAGYGMFLDALVKAAADGIGGDETVALKTRLLRELEDAQTPDGRITMFLDKTGFWDNHEGAYMIQALCLDHRWFGCRRSLETAVRLADSLMRDKARVTLGSETAFLLLAEETGEAKYVQWLEGDGVIRKSIDEYDRHLHVNGVQHVYTWLARSLGQMQYADFAKLKGAEREAMGAGAFAAFRRLRGPELSVTGSCSGVVQWGELWDSTQSGLGKWGETCATAYLMRLAAKMPEWDAQTAYGDVFERALYNAFFSAQSGDGLKYRYFTPFEEQAVWFDRDTYCCPNNFKREMFEVPNAVFYRTREGLAVNLFTPAELNAGGIRAKMTTVYPSDGAVTLEVAMAAPCVALRVPAWCEKATVAFAGETKTFPGGDWAEVRGDFTKGATIRLDLPMPIRLVRGMRAQEGKVAVLRGPCVYALECALNGLNRQFCGLWDLNAKLPMTFDAKDQSVTATFHERNNKHRVRTLKLTRYCRDNREKTYFFLTEPVPTVDDELTRPFGTR